MKTRVTLLCICMTVFLLAACSSSSKQQEQINYRTVTGQDNTNAVTENSPHVENESSIPIDEYYTDYKGINSDYETPVNGNLGINYKEDGPLSLICPDTKNNTVYFVNYGKDNYIYELKDGISTLLVEKKANYIQLWNNELYFLYDASDHQPDGQLLYPQKIYKYNLDTRDLTLVLDVDAAWLYVNKEGIFYTEVKDDNNDGIPDILSGYRLSFQSDVPQKGKYIFFLPYKEHLLIDTYQNGFILHNTLTDDGLTLTNASSPSSMASISGDILYTIDHRILYSLNLKTGEKTAYNIDTSASDIDFTNMIVYGYSELKDDLFVSLGGSLLIRINKTTGNMTRYYVGNCDITSDLFSDGNHLYAVAEVMKNPMANEEIHTALVELVVDENEITAKELTP